MVVAWTADTEACAVMEAWDNSSSDKEGSVGSAIEDVFHTFVDAY